jgi:hypothetical protein
VPRTLYIHAFCGEKKSFGPREKVLSLEELEAYELEERRLSLYFYIILSFASVFLLVRAEK